MPLPNSMIYTPLVRPCEFVTTETNANIPQASMEDINFMIFFKAPLHVWYLLWLVVTSYPKGSPEVIFVFFIDKSTSKLIV